MKGIITIIIVIIAIVIVGFMLFRDKTADPASVMTEEEITEESADSIIDTAVENGDASIDTTAEVMVVTYKDGEFAPKEITVSAGQKVRFVNESSGNMWVASDIHPTHQILLEFDDKKSIGNGENYEFTFTKTGKWNYHNHIKPEAVGVVIVE